MVTSLSNRTIQPLRLPITDAHHNLCGYTIANDVSARRWQKHSGAGQWVRGKSFDTVCPLGPAIVSPDAIDNPQSLLLRCYLNDQLMQECSTSDMIFPIGDLIEYPSTDTTLLPGTVILTGTPTGVGFARRPHVFYVAKISQFHK